MKVSNSTLKNREVLGYALTSAVTMGTIICGTFISGYWTDVVGISAAVVGLILLFARIFDGVTDLIMGVIIDKTHTRYGKAKPWFLVGAIGVMFASTLIFYTPDVSMTGKIIYAAIMYILVFAVFGTMTGVATPTLVNLITTNTNDRFKLGSWLFSVMFFTSMVLSMGLSLISAWGGGQGGFFKFSLMCNVIAAVIMVFCWFNIKERNGQEVLEKREKVSLKEFLATIFSNKYFLLVTGIYFLNNVSAGVIMGSTYYYVMYILKNPAFFAVLNIASYLPCILGMMIGPAISKKIGVTRLVVIGNIITAVAYAAILIAPANVTYITVCIIIGSFANGPACAVLSPFNAMSADYGEYKHGVARPAIYSAGTSVGTKVGVGVGGIVFSFILAATGFNGMADVQTSLANTGIVWSYVIAPAVAMLLFNLLLIPFFKLEKEYPTISAELERRHAKTE